MLSLKLPVTFHNLPDLDKLDETIIFTCLFLSEYVSKIPFFLLSVLLLILLNIKISTKSTLLESEESKIILFLDTLIVIGILSILDDSKSPSLFSVHSVNHIDSVTVDCKF